MNDDIKTLTLRSHVADGCCPYNDGDSRCYSIVPAVVTAAAVIVVVVVVVLSAVAVVAVALFHQETNYSTYDAKVLCTHTTAHVAGKEQEGSEIAIPRGCR